MCGVPFHLSFDILIYKKNAHSISIRKELFEHDLRWNIILSIII